MCNDKLTPPPQRNKKRVLFSPTVLMSYFGPTCEGIPYVDPKC